MNRERAWVVGGTAMVGLGVGFIFLQTSALFFVASLLIGIGLGLTMAAFISKGVNKPN
jgi:cyanate permease